MMPREPQEWKLEGKCSQDIVLTNYMATSRNDIFFEKDLEPDGIAYCSDCPIREMCLQFAMDHPEEQGIWGGLTSRQRKALRKKNLVNLDAMISEYETRWKVQLRGDTGPTAA